MAAAKSTHSRKGWKLKWHGHSRDPLWNRWRQMIQRCHGNSAKATYAGRGISVCPRWRESYEAFVEDMGRPPTPSHQLERVDNDGNYEPGNVRWASPKENSRNRRVNVFYTINGKTKTLSEWAESACVGLSTIRARLKAGWPLAVALTAPPKAFGFGRYAGRPHATGTELALHSSRRPGNSPESVQESRETGVESDSSNASTPIRLPYPAS